MKCIECGGQMESRRENHRYNASGLPRVILLDLEVSRCPHCGAEEVAIPRIEELHRLIAHTLVRKRGRLAAPEIRYLRKYLGWSATDFAERMGTAPETVSRWETDKTPMGPQADRLLRVLVTTSEPVSDYSFDWLTQIGAKVAEPTPVRLSIDSHGWHAAVA